ncbi:hypothetical protein BD770DRAFT_416223 [Pilaira anomala]|nr:hypothetical protein BD770DRAFT_416223 [Pilaira anomala]
MLMIGILTLFMLQCIYIVVKYVLYYLEHIIWTLCPAPIFIPNTIWGVFYAVAVFYISTLILIRILNDLVCWTLALVKALSIVFLGVCMTILLCIQVCALACLMRNHVHFDSVFLDNCCLIAEKSFRAAVLLRFNLIFT